MVVVAVCSVCDTLSYCLYLLNITVFFQCVGRYYRVSRAQLHILFQAEYYAYLVSVFVFRCQSCNFISEFTASSLPDTSVQDAQHSSRSL